MKVPNEDMKRTYITGVSIVHLILSLISCYGYFFGASATLVSDRECVVWR